MHCYNTQHRSIGVEIIGILKSMHCNTQLYWGRNYRYYYIYALYNIGLCMYHRGRNYSMYTPRSVHIRLFLHRLDNISEFLNTVTVYGTLALSRIEGIEVFNARFTLLATTLKKKQYDILEHRRSDFDLDYDDFKQQLAELEVCKERHVHSYLMFKYFNIHKLC